MSEQPDRDYDRADPSSCSGTQMGGPWDEWDESGPGLSDEYVWDAFELDDTLDDPEPECGDFWIEPSDGEEVDE
jgi:hypothetical protein